jgi:heat shock protein HtpX
MFFKLQNFKSVTGFFTHYTGLAAVCAGALAIAQPWTLALAAMASGGIFALSYKKNKEVLENDLVRHPAKHRFSPNLQSIVDRLFERSGMGHHKALVYDFETQAHKKNEDDSGIKGVVRKMLAKVGKTPNAAAFDMGKPVIIRVIG